MPSGVGDAWIHAGAACDGCHRGRQKEMMMTTETPRDEPSLVFARVNGMLLSEETVEDAVGLLARAAKNIVPRAIGAGPSVQGCR